MMIQCKSNEFTCHSKNQCILSTAVCDGIQVSLIDDLILGKYNLFLF
jgi:hypothetical protein